VNSFAPCHFPFKGWHVNTVYDDHLPCFVNGHRAVFDEVVVENEFKMLLGWLPNHSIQVVGVVSTFDLLPLKTISVASYSNNKRVAGNIVANCFNAGGSVMVVEPRSVLHKLHYGPIGLVYRHARFKGSVHCDHESFAHLCKQ